mmetsp:Transcript_30750/g.30240  ORF Transcript_30750/g.30240 Transcript_30750/m.30240 type:complete len:97 (-) Transcript_30750:792-1082(-)
MGREVFLFLEGVEPFLRRDPDVWTGVTLNSLEAELICLLVEELLDPQSLLLVELPQLFLSEGRLVLYEPVHLALGIQLLCQSSQLAQFLQLIIHQI